MSILSLLLLGVAIFVSDSNAKFLAGILGGFLLLLSAAAIARAFSIPETRAGNKDAGNSEPGQAPVPDAAATSKPIDVCNICGQRLDPKVSGQIAKFLELDWWPCPKCHLANATLVVSDRGVIAERAPLLVTIRRKPDKTYEARIGVGSIARPAEKTIGRDVQLGRDALFAMLDALNPLNKDRLLQLLKM